MKALNIASFLLVTGIIMGGTCIPSAQVGQESLIA